jgi:hypothetical protein
VAALKQKTSRPLNEWIAVVKKPEASAAPMARISTAASRRRAGERQNAALKKCFGAQTPHHACNRDFVRRRDRSRSVAMDARRLRRRCEVVRNATSRSFSRGERLARIFLLTFAANNLIYESHCDFRNRKI